MSRPTMEEVRAKVREMRRSGKLVEAVKSSGVNYSLDSKGKIVALYPDGRREEGTFQDGKFVPD